MAEGQMCGPKWGRCKVGFCGNDQLCTPTPTLELETETELKTINMAWNANRPFAYFDSIPGCPGYQKIDTCAKISSNNFCGEKWGRCTTGFCADNGICAWKYSVEIDLGNNNNNSNVNINTNTNTNANWLNYYNSPGYVNTQKNKAYDSRSDCEGYVAPNVCGFISNSPTNLCGPQWGRCKAGFCGDDGKCTMYPIVVPEKPLCAAGTCPTGYSQVCGDLPGLGIKRVIKVNTTEECKNRCEETRNCIGFEWSAIKAECHLNDKIPADNAKPFEDYLNCYKPEPTGDCPAQFCPAGYTQVCNDLPGFGMSRLRGIASQDECKNRCDSKPKCLGFEYSETTKQCV